MPVPKKKTSVSRQRMRRSHHGLTAKSGIVCSHCGEQIVAHRVCQHCGHYKGSKVLNVA